LWSLPKVDSYDLDEFTIIPEAEQLLADYDESQQLMEFAE